MNLKKKVIFGMVAGLFAVATVFNMSLLNDNGAGDVSLEDIAVMQQAQAQEWWEPLVKQCYGVKSMCYYYDGTARPGKWHW